MNEHTQSGIYYLAQTPSGEIIICQLNIIIFFLVSELIQKQVEKFIYTILLQLVQIQAWFQEVLFFPVGGISVVMRKQSNL